MKQSTSNALEILNKRFAQDEEYQRILAEERVNEQAARLIREARTEAGLTQAQLAHLIGTQQPVIARIENADYEGHTLALLSKAANALGFRIELQRVPLAPQVPKTLLGDWQTGPGIEEQFTNRLREFNPSELDAAA
jgi:ribosome-binding protein aMBF1 (putative translation factor)